MARFSADSAVIKTTDLNGGTAINIGAMTRMAVRTNTQVITDDSGDIYDDIISILSQAIDAECEFKCIDTILTYISLAGYCISSDGSHPGIDLFARILGDCKAPPLSTDNIRYRFPLGLACIGRISARRGQDVTISVMLKPITDGTNAPMSFTNSSITLPTRSGLARNLFTLGACKVGAIVLNDFDSLEIQYGLTLTPMTPAMASIWPDSVAVRKIQPVMLFTGYDPRVLDDSSGIPLLGKQASHANTLVQFVKRAGYSSFVSAATSAHIAGTFNGMAYVTDVFTGSGNSEATQGIVVRGIHDGTNVPLLWTIATTYDSTP